MRDIEKAIEELTLPDWIESTLVREITNEFGDPALQVVVLLAENAPPSSAREAYRPIRNALRSAIGKSCPNSWSHLVFRTLAEQAELDAPEHGMQRG